MRKRPLLLFACVFLTGLAYERYQRTELFLILLLFLIQELYFGIRYGRWRQMAGRGIVLLLVFFLGIFHMNREEGFRNVYLSELEEGNTVTVWGEVKKFETAEYGNRCILTDCYIRIHEVYENAENISFAIDGSKQNTIKSIEATNQILQGNDIMVYTSSDHYFEVGEIHEITGQMKKFSTARNQGNFDSEVFYQSQKIDFIVEAASTQDKSDDEEKAIRLLGKNQNSLEEAILSLKERLKRVYEDGMSEKTAGFYVAMLLGDKANLEESTKELFTIGGISHILAISGLHMSMIGRRVYTLLRKLRMGFFGAALWAGSILLAYCYMVGSGMSAVRAVGMMFLFFLAQCMGRSYDMLNALGVMVVILLWENPFLLEYSGFWFSVLALVGVGFTGKYLSALLEPVSIKAGERYKFAQKKLSAHLSCLLAIFKRKAEESFWMSIGITITTLPVVAYCYYEIPLYSTVVNMIVLPMLTPVFLLAVIGGLMGLWLPEAAQILFIPCGWLLQFYEWLCQVVSGFPGAEIICGCPTVRTIVVYYLLLVLGIFVLKRFFLASALAFQEKVSSGCAEESCRVSTTHILPKSAKANLNVEMDEKAACHVDIERISRNSEKNRIQKPNRIFFYVKIFKLLVCLSCIFLIIYPKAKPFEITFMDVGQGDGIYISTGDGVTCFIDGGSSSVKEVGEYRILPFLKSKGVAAIDYWFVTHADTDHISGVLEALESGFCIRHLLLAEAAPEDENYLRLLLAAKENQTEVLFMKAGDKICTKQSVFTCLYPKSMEIADKNEASLVLELEVFANTEGSSFRALFTGDISSEVEKVLLEQEQLWDIDVYKAAHHGSKYSNSADFLNVLSPEIAVISCSENNLYGHPATIAIENMQNAGADVYVTKDVGQITVWLNKENTSHCAMFLLQ